MPAVLRDKVLWLLLGAVLCARILAMLLAAQLWPRVGWLNHIYVDVWTWGEFFRHSQSRLIPYVEFNKEYPVGAGLLYWWMSGFVDLRHPAQTLRTHALFMMAADLVNTALFYAIAREIDARRALWATLLFSLNLTLVLLGPVRFESWVVATVLAGYLFHRRQKPLLATCFWSVGCWLKWFPALLIVAQEVRAYVVEGKRTQWLRSALVFLGVSAAFNLPFIVWSYRTRGSVDNWLGAYLFHLRRPLYWDTLLGVWQLWMGALPLAELA